MASIFEALALNAAEVAAEEERIRLRVRELDDTARKTYYTRFKAEMKDPDTYAVLNYFFLSGLHHMYLGKVVRGAVNLGMLLFGIGLLITGASLFGILLICSIVLIELMALFRAQVVVANHNNQIAAQILLTLRSP